MTFTSCKCPICSRIDGSASSAQSDADHELNRSRFKCDRCGPFYFARDLEEDIRDSGKPAFDHRTCLGLSWAARDAGDRAKSLDELLDITYDNYEAVADGAPVPRGAAYFGAVIETIGVLCQYPGRSATIRPGPFAAKVCLPLAALVPVLKQLQQDGLLEFNSPGTELALTLTSAGWRRLTIPEPSRHTDRAFVAMWFAPEMRPAYSLGIAPALSMCGYRPPFRADDPEHDFASSEDYTNRIDNRVLAEIRKARFVVADATGSRNSVYYEAGFADGLGIPVIWTCRADASGQLPFDTRQLAHILWSSPEELKAELIAKIERHGWSRSRS